MIQTTPLVLEIITKAAAAVTPKATDILDIGCGAGNYSLKMLRPGIDALIRGQQPGELEEQRCGVCRACGGGKRLLACSSSLRELNGSAMCLATATQGGTWDTPRAGKLGGNGMEDNSGWTG
jgi:hypothetical protein